MNVLIYGDTERSPALRHEVPVAIADPFLYGESSGRRAVTASSIDRPVLEQAGDLEILPLEQLGFDDLVADLPRWEADLEVAVRAVQQLGIQEASVPLEFPLGLADRLRAAGVEVRVDPAEFTRRRRAKTAAEIDGLRRAQRAADAGMAQAAHVLREVSDVGPDGALLGVAGERLTAEGLRAAIADACRQHGAVLTPDAIVGQGAQGALGHEPGSGPLVEGAPIIVDIWPQDEESGCFADMTRTFVVGRPPADIADWHRLTMEALDRVRAATKPGVTGRELWEMACDVYEAAGHRTLRTKQRGEVLTEGFFHGLGHGVGLAVHEEPNLGRGAGEPLIEGDVVTLEPGTYRQGYGGVRLEDLVLVTADGCETLTDFPYELTP